MSEPVSISVETSDGRDLEILVTGPDIGPAVLFHHGSPGAAVQMRHFSEAASARGLRLIGYSRPGYGGSTAQPGRTVASAAADSAAILDALAVTDFVTFGWSGGGPHALACAALLPERCRAAAVLAGPAPHDGEGLTWLGGMGPENVEEFGAAVAGIDQLSTFLEAVRPELQDISGSDIAAEMGGLVPEVDRAALTGDFAELLARSFHEALRQGIEGWRDDDLAFVAPWSFPLDQLTVPVAIWQGGQDLMVPYAHGVWLADHVADAARRLLDDEGHLSLVLRIGAILDDLLDLAGLG